MYSEKEETEEERRKRADDHYKELDKKRRQLEEDSENSKKKRDEMLKKAVPDGDKETYRNLMSTILSPTNLTDPSGSKSVAKGLVGMLGMVINTVKESVEGERSITISEEHHKQMVYASKEKEKVDQAFTDAEKERAEAEHKLRMLALEKSSLGDIESLLEASEYLAKIDGELMNIITFWDNLAAFLKNLTQKGEMGECFLEAIEDDECAELFNAELLKVESGWKHFGAICSRYVQHEEVSIKQVYSFLSDSIDRLSNEERQERSKRIIAQIKAKMPPRAIEAKKESK